ncbi:MAG: endonuclease/exonuclease/phosphatase family protein [Verrucomicrobia bacterium]|nr:endonuclease/exonuclease/phosphatase family protein [Verrucomicrobiota bacterium]
MAKLFSVASWNVEHFDDDASRIGRVVKFLNDQNPDVFALYEVEGKAVFAELTQQMPKYHFHITEGQQTQEILVGARGTLSAFFTQKLEFKEGNTFLRPGALLTVTVNGDSYPLLFLHTKSGNAPVGLGIRDDMLRRALDFRKTLNKASPNGKANYIVLGDLNTMGMKYPFQKDIEAEVELKKLDADAKKRQMRRLGKTKPATWWNGPGSSIPPSNLDQIVAADHLKFKAFAGGAEADVRGWASLGTDAEKASWIKSYSDHSLLLFQVEK